MRIFELNWETYEALIIDETAFRIYQIFILINTVIKIDWYTLYSMLHDSIELQQSLLLNKSMPDWRSYSTTANSYVKLTFSYFTEIP